MLTALQIEALVQGKLSEEAVEAQLIQLTPESITPSLLASFVEALQASNVLPLSLQGSIFDCCGTGGSGLPHYNISTAVAFVLAAGGVRVAKFGNRGMSNAHGSADFLECLGIPLQLTQNQIERCFDVNHLVFLFAPQFYPSLGQLAPIRKRLGFKTIFNFLGPLLNPAQPTHRLLGVSAQEMQSILANYLKNVPNNEHSLVVRGENGLDEMISPGNTTLIEVRPEKLKPRIFTSPYANIIDTPSTITVEDNLACFNQLLQGQDLQSRYAHFVYVNAGAGFYTAGKTSTIQEGCHLAEDLIKEGLALQKLQEYQAFHA